jgi:hypothetical protein
MAAFAMNPFEGSDKIANPQWGQVTNQSAQMVGQAFQNMGQQVAQERMQNQQIAAQKDMQNQKIMADTFQNVGNLAFQAGQAGQQRKFEGEQKALDRTAETERSQAYRDWMSDTEAARTAVSQVPTINASDAGLSTTLQQLNLDFQDNTEMLNHINAIRLMKGQQAINQDSMNMLGSMLNRVSPSATGQGGSTPADILSQSFGTSGSAAASGMLSDGLMQQSQTYSRWRDAGTLDMTKKVDPNQVLSWGLETGQIGQRGTSDDVLGVLYQAGATSGNQQVGDLMRRYLDDFGGNQPPGQDTRTTMPIELTYAADQYARKMSDSVGDLLQDPNLTSTQRQALTDTREKLLRAQSNHAASAAGYHSVNRMTKDYEDYAGKDLWAAAAGPNGDKELADADAFYRSRRDSIRTAIKSAVTPEYMRAVKQLGTDAEFKRSKLVRKYQAAVQKRNFAEADTILEEMRQDQIKLQSDIQSQFPRSQPSQVGTGQ